MSHLNINFDFPINDLEGKEIGRAHKILATFLYGKPDRIDMLKAHDWVTTLMQTSKLAMDRTDAELLEQSIKSSTLNNVCAPLLIAIKSAKEEIEKKLEPEN